MTAAPILAVITAGGGIVPYGLAAGPVPAILPDGAIGRRHLAGPNYWARQVGRAGSRLLNALTGGEGDTTYSAGSYALLLAGQRRGAWRVAAVDWLNGQPGHCEAAHAWHLAHGLLAEDAAD